MRLREGGDGEFFPQGVYFIRHTGLYKANRRNEERTSEPVCRADPVSHTLGTIINYSDCSGG